MEHPDLLAVLERGLRSEDDTWRKDVVHVSDVAKYGIPPEQGGGCALELQLRLQGADARPFTAGELLMFNRGKSLHEEATRLLLAGGIEREGWHIRYVEVSMLEAQAASRLGVVPDPVVDGTLDIALHGGPEGDAELIYDYKTVRGRAMDFLRSRGPYGHHVLQVGTYAMGTDADGCGILYLDREGQNFGFQAPLERNDGAVLAAAARVREVATARDAAAALEPQLELRELKTQTSVYVHEPFQCQRCVFRGYSCPGAVPEKLRPYAGKVVGKIKNGEFSPSCEEPEMVALAERLLWSGAPTSAPNAGADDDGGD